MTPYRSIGPRCQSTTSGNLSSTDQEYFADGVAEEILDLLARIPGLHVPARTSSFYFKGKSEDIPAIARHLMVANVLEGSVRKSGNHLRITVQLIRADNGDNLWSETYDRTLDDIFKVQDEIAGRVVTALKLSIGANAAPRTVPTNNPEVHALLLQAQFLLNRETQDGLTRAIDYLQRAVLLDPGSAAAWALLSEALTVAWVDGWLPTGRTFQQEREQATQAAERAVAMDPKLGGAHEGLAMVRHWFDWDWAASAREFEQARALDPADTDALVYAGRLAQLRRRLGEALRLYDDAVAQDP